VEVKKKNAVYSEKVEVNMFDKKMKA